jgi:hypothetical protein
LGWTVAEEGERQGRVWTYEEVAKRGAVSFTAPYSGLTEDARMWAYCGPEWAEEVAREQLQEWLDERGGEAEGRGYCVLPMRPVKLPGAGK